MHLGTQKIRRGPQNPCLYRRGKRSRNGDQWSSLAKSGQTKSQKNEWALPSGRKSERTGKKPSTGRREREGHIGLED